MKKLLQISLMSLVFVLLLVACNDDQETEPAEDTQTGDEQAQDQTENPNSIDISDEELVDEEQVVVTVNGEEVLGSYYNMMYSQTKTILTQYGQDTTDLDMLKERTLDAIVQQELIAQEADEIGVEVSDEEVQNQLEQTKSNFETDEEYQNALEELDMTEEGLKQQIVYEIKREQFIEQEIPEAEISDEEIQAYYDEVASQNENEEFPALEDVEAQIREQLAMEEQQSQLNEIVQQLEEESEIEKTI
ncbi:SurA N-terminal domain-containing protein [Aquibacillus koreensis]|uniref:SurA N-terminal domain-containing protein n=1 Tax=Aquibacillus koreensis TaxID=279446 RepID=A0A9X3WMN5_9BACI|nr:SurA N-terminal domain-containing protein [Aquibacillus koreensis]MCT2537225.1 SurA N-terminal domain-containing protein [Aquibacillus koreensis]MDC3421573.1 SurA N-terminal domain-containing protein [Aquibacillus koreensis]